MIIFICWCGPMADMLKSPVNCGFNCWFMLKSNSCFAPFLHLKSCLNLPPSDHQTGWAFSCTFIKEKLWLVESRLQSRYRKISQMERTRIPPEVNIKRGLWKLTPVSYFAKEICTFQILFSYWIWKCEKVTKITSKRQGDHYAKKKKKVLIFHYFHRIENSLFPRCFEMLVD